MVRKDTHSRFLPIIIAMAAAALGLIGLLLVNHGPWTKPKVRTEAMIQQGTTAGSATAVGATVTPTEQKPEFEPGARPETGRARDPRSKEISDGKERAIA
jgi:hypothetical protein